MKKTLYALCIVIAMLMSLLINSCTGSEKSNEAIENPVPELLQIASLVTDQNNVIMLGWKDNTNGPAFTANGKEYDIKTIAACSLLSESEVVDYINKTYTNSNGDKITLYTNSYYSDIYNHLTYLHTLDLITNKTNYKVLYECTIKNLKIYSDIYSYTNNFATINGRLSKIKTNLDILKDKNRINSSLYSEAINLISSTKTLNDYNKSTLDYLMNYNNYEDVVLPTTMMTHLTDSANLLNDMTSGISKVSNLLNS